MNLHRVFLAALGGALALAAFGVRAEANSVIVGYQTDAQPSSVVIANDEFAKATGMLIFTES